MNYNEVTVDGRWVSREDEPELFVAEPVRGDDNA
jgi:hypothetical protein